MRYRRSGAGGLAERGLTLIEVTITIAIIALVSAVAVTSVSNISKAELRASSSKLAGFVRQTYDDAALGGQTHRLTFDFESKTVTASATDQVLAFEPDSNVLAEANKAGAEIRALSGLADELLAKAQEQGLSGGSGEESTPLTSSALSAMFDINSLADRAGMAEEDRFTDAGKTLDLGEDVQLFDVWIQGMREAATEGKVYLYFFPHGYTQDAIIHLVDEGGDLFAVKVSALTGRTRIQAGRMEVPK